MITFTRGRALAAIVFVMAACGGGAAKSITGGGGGGGGNGRAADKVEDFSSYSSISDYLADPRYTGASEDVGTGQMVLDK
ncbi:MAG TPA: hypothetical protein VH113_01820, partial [Gemmatimonadales bacterium]|nr:hypothetical protein [Gemmatimonadales bacterium]